MSRKMTALIVEPGSRLAEMLGSDVEVVSANGMMAAWVQPCEAVDVLVVDAGVPQALEATAALKMRWGHPPVIWVGRSWDATEVDAALGAGACEVVVDPVPGELAARIKMLFKLRRTEASDLRILAYSDDLTGLPNRRFLRSRLKAAFNAARARSDAMSLLVLDIDRFKAVNDLHGHAAGDRVLVELARVLKATSRATDIFGRWGGEEFLYLVQGPLAAAEAQAERIRAAIAAFPFGAPELNLHLTVSIGIAQQESGDRIDDLVERADRCLYQAKHQGRDRVVSQPDVRLAELA